MEAKRPARPERLRNRDARALIVERDITACQLQAMPKHYWAQARSPCPALFKIYSVQSGRSPPYGYQASPPPQRQSVHIYNTYITPELVIQQLIIAMPFDYCNSNEQRGSTSSRLCSPCQPCRWAGERSRFDHHPSFGSLSNHSNIFVRYFR